MAIAAAIGLAGAWLVSICWRRRSILGGLCAVTTIALLALATAAGLHGSGAKSELLGSLISLFVGTVLLVLGQALWRLLDEQPGGSEPEIANPTARGKQADTHQMRS